MAREKQISLALRDKNSEVSESHITGLFKLKTKSLPGLFRNGLAIREDDCGDFTVLVNYLQIAS
jgi:hypothetical protein